MGRFFAYGNKLNNEYTVCYHKILFYPFFTDLVGFPFLDIYKCPFLKIGVPFEFFYILYDCERPIICFENDTYKHIYM